MLSHKIFFLLLFFSGILTCLGQLEYQETKYGKKEGLPTQTIYKTVNVNSGELFLATHRGILMFDGYRFTPNRFLDKMTVTVEENKEKIYLFELFGLCEITSINQKPKVIEQTFPEDDNPNNDHFENLFIDSKNRIWGTDFENVKFYDPSLKKTNSFLLYPGSKDLQFNVSFIEINENEIWIASTRGLKIWNAIKNKIEKHPNSYLSKLGYLTAIKLRNGEILFTTNEGNIFTLEPKTGKISPKNPLPYKEWIIGVNETDTGLILSTNQSVYVEIKNQYHEIYNSGNTSIFHTNLDGSTGIIWLSTNDGLIKLQPINPAIKTFYFGETFPVTSLTEDNFGAIYMSNLKGEVWKNSGKKNTKIYEDENERIYNVHHSKGQIFLSGNNGIKIWDGKTFKNLKLANFHADIPIVKTLLVNPHELWVVYETAPIERYNWPDLERIEKPFKNDSSFWKDNKWQDIYMDNQNKIWLVGWMPKSFGITFYDPSLDIFVDTSIKEINPGERKFVGDYYTKIGQGNNETLLFTAFGGWNRTNEKGQILQLIDIHNYPIIGAQIRGISEDDDNNVYFASEEGFHIYRPDFDYVYRLTQIDGLPTNYLINSFLSLKNDKIMMGVDGGTVEIDTKKILKTQLKNRLKISSVLVDGKIKEITNNQLELTKRERDLTVFFSDLSFLPSEKVNFSYKFSDEKDWIDLGSKSEINLNHISPGNYTIQIKVEDNLGNKQENELSISLHAQPPFTKSIVFYILLLIAAFILAYLINSYLWKRKAKEQRFLRRIKEAEMKTLRSQMNPHFLFNTLNSINSYIIQNQTNEASKYLTTFSKLMRSILDNSKHELISLEMEFHSLKLYLELESARLEHSFDYRITTDKNVDKNSIFIPPLIIQPFAENAIWHGLRNKIGDGFLKIHATNPSENILNIFITDNGIGREASKKLKKGQNNHKSYGIGITAERLRMLDSINSVKIKDLYNPDNTPAGTEVVLTLKLKDYD